jgi:hypothetical protein
LFLLFGLVWFAPQMVANSALRDKILSAAVPKFEGRISVAAVGLGWLSPVAVDRLEVADAQDEPFLRVAALRTQKSLLGLLWRPRAPGLIGIQEPQLRVALRDDGSNVEDALAPLLQDKSSGSWQDIRLEVRGAVVEIRQQETGQQWNVAQLDADVRVPGDATQPLAVRLADRVKDRWFGKQNPCRSTRSKRWSAVWGRTCRSAARCTAKAPCNGPITAGSVSFNWIGWRAARSWSRPPPGWARKRSAPRGSTAAGACREVASSGRPSI